MDNKPDPQEPNLSLEILRGRTAHSIRPIHSDRFLIGSGEWCHLRLGGDTPALHSVLVRKNGLLTIEAIATSPVLLVNGVVVESAELRDADQLSIGGITLQLHGEQQPAVDSSMKPIDIDAMLALDQPAADPTQLSAEELIDQLESDMSMVDGWENGREQAAASLLDNSEMDASQVEETHRPVRMLRELETAVHSLNRIADDLNHDTHMSEQEISQAADSLVDYQQQIVGRLDDVLQRIAELKETDQRRAA
jgi:hypothetical protein